MKRVLREAVALRTEWKGEQGYLLMEAVVAIFIVSTALVAIAGMFPQSLQTIAAADHYTAATVMAQEQMEMLKSHDDLFWGKITFPYQTGPVVIPGTEFYQTAKAEISPLDPEYPVKQRVIKLTVCVERTGGEQVTLVSYTLRELPQFLK
ncbi:hypothetical protein [Sporomusa sp.]|uniref:type IV pilus modification PilV family protein n=1 Tax=Sporomusa sp. TaxID=2078658 RepID=UPI002C7D9700|nr:hypothetical protein [Sporomusa sp.]HWR08179.1 hypothetical protein [Sporomusa sp.]